MARKVKVVKKKKKNKKKNFLYYAVMAVLVCIIAVSGYQLYGILMNYLEGRNLYSNLSDKFRFERKIDFDALKKINPDIIGWIYSEDTMIDYPVVQAKDNEYYLHRLFDKTYNESGSIFLDYTKNSNFDNRNSVLYGHHMRDGSMFASLMGYKKQKYYNKHKVLTLYTPEKTYKAQVACGFVINARNWDKNGFAADSRKDALVNYAYNNSTFKSKVQIGPEDDILTLSTCSYEVDEGRYVLVCKLIED